MARYYYFKPSGKWKYEGEGASVPTDGKNPSHELVYELNGGEYPGIVSDLEGGKLYTIFILDEESYPRMIPATRSWN